MTAAKFRVSEPMTTKVEGMTVFNTDILDSTKQKMFFGPPLGVQRYDKFKYPIFDKLTQTQLGFCLLYTSPSPRDRTRSRMPSSA